MTLSMAQRVTVRLLSTEAIADADERLLARLGADEAARAARFREAADRKSHVAAHALLRTLLSQAIPGEPQPGALRFVATVRGKPMLAPGAAPRDLRFNLSHCRGMVAVAMAEGAELGIDVEALARRDFDDHAIAQSHFCAAEREHLARIADGEPRKAAMLALWTAKEALVKALGEGLAMPLDSFCADLERNAYLHYDAAHGDGDWSLTRWQRPGHCVSLAAPAGMAVECRESRWDASASRFVEGPLLRPISAGVPA